MTCVCGPDVAIVGEVGVLDERRKTRPKKKNGIRASSSRVGLWGRRVRSLNGFS